MVSFLVFGEGEKAVGRRNETGKVGGGDQRICVLQGLALVFFTKVCGFTSKAAPSMKIFIGKIESFWFPSYWEKFRTREKIRNVIMNQILDNRAKSQFPVFNSKKKA